MKIRNVVRKQTLLMLLWLLSKRIAHPLYLYACMYECVYVCVCESRYITEQRYEEEEGKQEDEKELGKKKWRGEEWGGVGWGGVSWSTMARGGEVNRRMLEIAKDKEPRMNECNWSNHVLETSRRREWLSAGKVSFAPSFSEILNLRRSWFKTIEERKEKGGKKRTEERW